jgi:hypothetical protein
VPLELVVEVVLLDVVVALVLVALVVVAWDELVVVACDELCVVDGPPPPAAPTPAPAPPAPPVTAENVLLAPLLEQAAVIETEARTVKEAKARRIGRSLHLGRGIAAVGVKTPVQTVRADFPHTAYR